MDSTIECDLIDDVTNASETVDDDEWDVYCPWWDEEEELSSENDWMLEDEPIGL